MLCQCHKIKILVIHVCQIVAGHLRLVQEKIEVQEYIHIQDLKRSTTSSNIKKINLSVHNKCQFQRSGSTKAILINADLVYCIKLYICRKVRIQQQYVEIFPCLQTYVQSPYMLRSASTNSSFQIWKSGALILLSSSGQADLPPGGGSTIWLPPKNLPPAHEMMAPLRVMKRNSQQDREGSGTARGKSPDLGYFSSSYQQISKLRRDT